MNIKQTYVILKCKHHSSVFLSFVFNLNYNGSHYTKEVNLILKATVFTVKYYKTRVYLTLRAEHYSANLVRFEWNSLGA